MARESYEPKILNKAKLQTALRGTEFISLDVYAEKHGINLKTLERCINAIKEDGITVEKKMGKNREWRIYDPAYFSLPKINTNEFTSIRNAIVESTHLKDEQLKNKLMKIIYANLEDLSEYRETIDIIRQSMKNKTKFLVTEYHGRDRINKNLKLTAVHLDITNKKVYVHDNKINTRTYNLENIKGIMLTKDPADKFLKWEPKTEKLDPFGFNFNGKNIKVELLLTQFAKSQLVRQFPVMVKFLTISKKIGFAYNLDIVVSDIQPIARFVTGLLNEIKIESVEAKELIKDYIQKRVLDVHDSKFK